MRKLPDSKIIKLIYQSTPEDEIVRAFNGDMIGAGLVGNPDDAFTETILGSSLLNASTASMRLLDRKPDKPLAKEKIEIPENASTLGKYVLGMINNSISRPRARGTTAKFTSRPAGIVDTGTYAEERFAKACDLLPHEHDDVPHGVLVDRKRRPMMLLKEIGFLSGMSLRQIALNGILYPAGTLFRVQESPDYKSTIIDGYEVIHSHRTESDGVLVSNIDAMSPQRYSLFSFLPTERSKVFRPADNIYLPGITENTIETSGAADEPEFLNRSPYQRELASLSIQDFAEAIPDTERIKKRLPPDDKTRHRL